MAALGDLIVKIGGNLDGLDAALGEIGPKLNSAVRTAEREFSGFDKLGSSLTSMGLSLTAALTVPIAGAGAAAITMATNFDSAMHEVNSLLGASATTQSFQALSAGVLQLSRDLGIDAVGAAHALYEALSANVPQENAIDFIRTAAQGAIAGMTDTRTAVDGLTTVLNAFHLPVTDAAKVMDAMFQGVVIGKYHFDELSHSIGSAASSASVMGISYQELIAAGTTITRQGITIDEAFTQLTMAMKSLIAPNKEMNSLLHTAGFESGQAAVTALGLEGALSAVAKAANGNNAILEKATGRVEGFRAILELTGANAKTASSDLEAINNSAGATARAFGEIDKSTARQFQRLVTDLKDTGIELGTHLLPAVNAVLHAFMPLADALGSAVKWFENLPAPAQAVIAAFATLAAAIGPIVLGLGAFLTSFSAIGTALTALAGFLGIGVTALLGWAAAIAAAVAALAALGVWIYANWESIKAVVSQAWSGLTEVWTTAWTAASSYIMGAWDSFKSAIQSPWESIVGVVKGAWSVLTTVWAAEWDIIKAAIFAVWNGLKQPFADLWRDIVAIVGTVWNDIATGWGVSWDAAKAFITAAWSTFKTDVSNIWGGIVGAVGEAWNTLGGSWDSAWGNAKAFILAAWDTFKGEVSTAWEGIKGIVGSVWEGVKDLWDAAWQVARSFITSAWETFKSDCSTIWDGITSIVGAVWGEVKSEWDTSWSAVKSFITSAWNTFKTDAKNIWDGITDVISAVWDPVKRDFETVWNGIKSLLTGAWNAIKQSAETVWNAVVEKLRTFIEWAQKIPGVNKLMNLDEAWNSAKRLESGTKDATTAVQAQTKAHQDGKPVVEGHTGAVKDATTAIETHTEKVKDYNINSDIFAAKLRILQTEHNTLVREIAAAQMAVGQWPAKMAEVDAAQQSLTKSMDDYISKLDNVAKIKTPEYIKAVNDSIKPNVDLDGALKTLGITSTEKYDQVAKDAKAAYDAVMGSGMATTWEKDNAMLKMLKAQAAAMKANGQDIPADMQKMIDDLNTKVNDKSNGMPKVQAGFEKFGKDSAKAITDAFDGVAFDLITGKGSFKERLETLWKDLAGSIVDNFVHPATKAIADFITGAIADLMSGKGLGGLIQTVKDLGSAMADIFGGASNAVGTATSTGGTVAGAAGSAGGAAGGAAAGGIAGMVTAIAGVVTAVTGVISIFQNMHQETSLNAIEHNTRYSMMYLGERSDGGILGQLFYIGDVLAFGTIVKKVEELANVLVPNISFFSEQASSTLGSILGQIGDVATNTYWSLQQLQQSQTTLNSMLSTMQTQGGGGQTTVNVSVTTSGSATDMARDIGNALASDLRLRGAFA